MTPGERLRKWRNEKKLSTVYVAEQIGVKDPTISRFENGQTQIKADTLKKLSDVFGISIDWLLTGKQPNDILENIPAKYREIIDIYDSLTPNRQQDLINIGKTFLQPAENQAIEESSSVSRKAG